MHKISRWKVSVTLIMLLGLVLSGSLFALRLTTTYAASAKASQSSWSMLGNNPQHTGFNSQEHVLTPSNVSKLQLDWSYSTGVPILSSPAIVDGVVFFGSNDYKLYALNAKTGTRKWSYYTGSFVQSSPAVVNGIVYFSSSGQTYDAYSGGTGYSGGIVYALNAQTGAVKWSYSTGSSVYSSPTVVNGIVYIGSASDDYNSQSGGIVYALDAQTGAVKWSYNTEGGVYTSPTVANGIVYVGARDSNVYALDAQTGAKKWIYSTGGEVDSSPVVVNAVIYVSSNDGDVYALNALTGKLKWTYSLSNNSSLAVANGVVYISSNDGSVYALDARTGTRKWGSSITNNYAAISVPTVANGVVYVNAQGSSRYPYTFMTTVYALDVQTGVILWSYDTEAAYDRSPNIPASAPPVINNGMVYAGSFAPKLYVFHLSA